MSGTRAALAELVDALSGGEAGRPGRSPDLEVPENEGNP